jgi:hypothetical protein
MADEQKSLPITPAEFGAIGGKKRAENLSPEDRKEIAQRAASARWSLPKAEHEGDLKIGDMVLQSAVLEDGRRVLLSGAILAALGRPWKGTYKRTERPNFIEANNLVPFIPNELYDVLEPIEYLNLRGQKALGYRAELLPLVCETYLKAREEGGLNPRQKDVAQRAEQLARGLSKIGIIALVDEATGYQQIRARDELQTILAAYISPELMPYTSRFPQNFYAELHKVRGWKYAPGSNKRNHYIGKLTNELIYKHLPDGVLEELQKKNPIVPNTGRRKALHYKYLTEDVGDPHLQKQIIAVTTLLSVSDDWAEFARLFSKKFKPKAGDLFALPPPVDDEGPDT